MLLSKHTAVKLQPDQANIISHMCYAAYKLWNVCNYERTGAVSGLVLPEIGT